MGDSLLLLIWFIKLFHIIIVELVCEKSILYILICLLLEKLKIDVIFAKKIFCSSHV